MGDRSLRPEAKVLFNVFCVCVAIGKVASVIGEGAGNRINRHRDGNHSQTESEST